MNVKEDFGRRMRRLFQSRLTWKRRVAEKQEMIRYLRIRVRDLEISRELWKERATAAESTDGAADSMSAEPWAAQVSGAAASVKEIPVGEGLARSPMQSRR